MRSFYSAIWSAYSKYSCMSYWSPSPIAFSNRVMISPSTVISCASYFTQSKWL